MSWFQFHLRDLFFLVLIVGLICGWWVERRQIMSQEAELRTLRLEVTCLRIKEITGSKMSEEKKLAALAPYVKLGDDWEEIEERLGGASSCSASGPVGWGDRQYYQADLWLTINPRGQVHGIGYPVPKDATTREVKWLPMVEYSGEGDAQIGLIDFSTLSPAK